MIRLMSALTESGALIYAVHRVLGYDVRCTECDELLVDGVRLVAAYATMEDHALQAHDDLVAS